MKKKIVSFISICIACIMLFGSCSLIPLPDSNTGTSSNTNSEIDSNTNSNTNSGTSTNTNSETSTNTDSETDGETNTKTESNTDVETEDGGEVETTQDVAKIVTMSANRSNDVVEITIEIESIKQIRNAKINIYDIKGDTLATKDDVTITKGKSMSTIEVPCKRLEVSSTVSQKDVEETGIQILKAEMELPASEQDDVRDNFAYASYIYNRNGRALIVVGDQTQSTQLDQIWDTLLSTGTNFEFCDPESFPRSLELLLDYDKIILMNVDYSKLPPNAIEAIKSFVKKLGRELLVTCGDSVIGTNGEVKKTELDEMLPVKFQFDEEKLLASTVIVVDLSSSMKELVSDSGVICTNCEASYESAPIDTICTSCNQESTFSKPTRYHVALASTKSFILEAELDPEDLIGVVVFDQDYHVALEIQPIGDEANREVLCEKMAYEFEHYYYAYYLDKQTGEESEIRINPSKDGESGSGNKYVDGEDAIYVLPPDYLSSGMDKATGDYIKSRGTSYKWPIQEASAMLQRARNMFGGITVQSVIFMSDGAPNDLGSGYEGIVERMANGGVITSAVAIGTSDTKAIQELDKIATAGKGKLFLASNSGDLDEIFEKTAQEILLGKVEDVEAIINSDSLNSKIYEGFRDDFDTIYGYYSSQIIEDAERILYVENLRPLYAEWDVGLGKVAIFTSDLGNEEWTGSMFDDTDGAENVVLIKNMFAVDKKHINSTGLEIAVEKTDSSVKLTIDSYSIVEENEQMVAKFYSFNGNEYVLEKDNIYEFEKTSNDTFELTLDNEGNEPYIVIMDLIRVNEDGSAIVYFVDGDDPIKDRVSFMVVK